MSKVIKTWKGFETQKEKLSTLASRYKEADAILELKAGDAGAFEYTVRAFKAPDKPNIPEGRAAGLASDELVNYHKYLVLELGLDHFMVRKVWSEILGSSQ
jgi:hypothetical protein